MAANPIIRSESDIELDDEADPESAHESTHLLHVVDARIRWIHFILGNAVLLPWNGASDLLLVSVY